MTHSPLPAKLALWVAIGLGVGSLGGAPARAEPAPGFGDSTHLETDDRAELTTRGWRWPLDAFRISEGYVEPAHRYGVGHRGIDLAPGNSFDVVAPAGGVIAFAGQVAGRGILTIDHGDGLVTTLEPVETHLVPGDRVERGDVVAALSVGGHARAGEVHFGVRLHGEYINPLLLLGGVPRAVLLPCC